MDNEVVTEIIFDYDDTLSPSTFLESNGYKLNNTNLLSPNLVELFKVLSQSIIKFTQLANSLGNLTIITNSRNGWIPLSAEKFIPDIANLMKTTKIKYARSDYENKYPHQPITWKYFSFKNSLSDKFIKTNKIRQIISFGDSNAERDSMCELSKEFKNTYFKSI